MKPIEKIVDLDELQRLQDDFAYAVGMAFVTVDYKGVPVTKPSGFTDFCNHVRSHPEMLSRCYQCDAHGGLHAAISGEPHIYYCHAGLVDYAVPLILDGVYCGSVMGGQVKTYGDGASSVKTILSEKSHWQKYPELQSDWEKIKEGDLGKIRAVLRILQNTILNLMQKGYMELLSEELKQKDQEVLGERSRRKDLEKIIKRENDIGYIPVGKADMLFSRLSLIGNLAYIEKAEQTERSIYAFSDMLRYTLERKSNQISSLGEELSYIENYLTMEKLRLGDKFSYSVKVPEDFHTVSCPASMIQPIVENAIEYTVECQPEGGLVEITGREQDGDLAISIRDSGTGFPKEIIENINNEVMPAIEERNRYDLYSLNHNMCILFGKKYHLQIENLPDHSGAVVTIRIPMSNNLMK